MLFAFLKKPAAISIIIIVILAAGGYLYFSGKDKSEFQTALAVRGDLVQMVSVTGRVKPAQSVDLAFEKGGRVARVSVKVGDKVFAGQTLVSLENADLAAQLKVEEAKSNELRSGARPEDIKIQEIKVINAEVAYGDSKTGLSDVLRDVFTKADDAIRNKVDQFISNPKTSNPEINFQVSDSQLERDIESERISIERVLTTWDSKKAKDNLNQIKSFLDKVSLAVNELKASGSISQTTVDDYRADVLTARNNINTAISNLNSAEEELRGTESALALANEELAKLLAGTRPEQIEAQEAQVAKTRAELAKSIIRAPISGTVTREEAKVGEIVAANAVVAALISEANFEVEANIPEADIAKISLGNEANVTLDAYGSEVVFKASVSSIDPAETIIEGVATYKTTLQFAEDDNRIKSGMTANVEILTAKRENIIYIPQRAVITKDGLKTVRKLERGEIKEILVKAGLAADGNIEILEGLEEGDEVVIFVR